MASPLTPPNVLDQHCTSHSILEMLSGRWNMLVLYALIGERRRYSEIQAQVQGISQKMLTQTLRQLERDGLVKRTVYPVVPPHTEYELTPMGRELEGIVTSLAQWAHQHIAAVLTARAEYDSR